jgi:hypothetical protein
MKIAVQCKSPLLQKSLELFLEKYLSSPNKCDIIIRDEACLDNKRCFYIGSEEGVDLKKPFSKAQLILSLEDKFLTLNPLSAKKTEVVVVSEKEMDFKILEDKIELLTQEYKKNIIKVVKTFYEK